MTNWEFLEKLIDVKVKEVNSRFSSLNSKGLKVSSIYLVYPKSKNNLFPTKFYVGTTANKLTIRLNQHIRESFGYKDNSTTIKTRWIRDVILSGGELEVIELVRVPHFTSKIRYQIETEFINYFKRNGLNLTNTICM